MLTTKLVRLIQIVLVANFFGGLAAAQDICKFEKPKIYYATVSAPESNSIISVGRVHYLAGNRLRVALSLPACAAITDVRVASAKPVLSKIIHTALSDKVISRSRVGTRRRVVTNIDLDSLKPGAREPIQITVQNPRHVRAKTTPSKIFVFTVVKLVKPLQPFTAATLLRSRAMSLDDCGLWEDFDVGTGADVAGGDCAGGDCAGLLFDTLHPDLLTWKATGGGGPSEGCFVTEIECPGCWNWPDPDPPGPKPPCESVEGMEDCVTECFLHIIDINGKATGADIARCIATCADLLRCRP